MYTRGKLTLTLESPAISRIPGVPCCVPETRGKFHSGEAVDVVVELPMETRLEVEDSGSKFPENLGDSAGIVTNSCSIRSRIVHDRIEHTRNVAQKVVRSYPGFILLRRMDQRMA